MEALFDGFLSTHTLCNHKGRRQNGPPLVPTNQQNLLLFLGAFTSIGARSQHLRRKSRGLPFPAGSAGRLRRFCKKEKKKPFIQILKYSQRAAAALWSPILGPHLRFQMKPESGQAPLPCGLGQLLLRGHCPHWYFRRCLCPSGL